MLNWPKDPNFEGHFAKKEKNQLMDDDLEGT